MQKRGKYCDVFEHIKKQREIIDKNQYAAKGKGNYKMDFMLGCNYWSSNAGTEMWRKWDETKIREDFEILSANGVKYLRVFPNWRDFQPVSPLFDYGMKLKEYRVNEHKLPDNKYFLDNVMLERFERLCELSEEFDFKLIVGLLTGWMSGRLFVPPALYGKNLYTDSTALMFELKFIEGFVQRLKKYPAIYAWNLGNECNCMSEADSYETSEVWTGIICNAIRANDSSRPIISGMHGLSPDGNWRIDGQAAYTDMLTIHPYPYFVEHCTKDTFSSMRTLLHATCQAKYYADLADRPCLVEEIGNLGPMMCDNEMAANFLKVNMFSNWAHGASGVLWWCANEQIMLEEPPYCWNMCETELGMIDRYKKEKPVLLEMKQFSDWLSQLDFTLPKANEDAVCILSEGQDHWGIAYMSYILAKQAKVNLKFAYAKQEIPQSDIYLLPSVSSLHMMNSLKFNELKKRIYDGAVLYISVADTVISDFESLTGVHIKDSKTTSDSGSFEFRGKTLSYARDRRYIVSANGSKVMCSDEQGIPLITSYNYGKGTVYYVNFPVESMLLTTENVQETAQYEIYREIFKEKINNHIADSACPYIGITQHDVSESSSYIVMINYSDKQAYPNLIIKKGYSVECVIKGSLEKIDAFETTIIKVKKA